MIDSYSVVPARRMSSTTLESPQRIVPRAVASTKAKVCTTVHCKRIEAEFLSFLLPRKEKGALLNDHFSQFFFYLKINVLYYWKAQFLSFENQKEKVLNLEAFGRNKKRAKIIKNCFHNFIKEKKFKIISVSLWWAITFKPFKIQTWDWSRMKENSKIFKITLTEKCLKVCLK